jgi:putative restriction endonuclease
MTKAVLTTKVNSTYDDLPEERYHFPKTYLRQVEASVGDWVVYYEPRRQSGDKSSRGGRQSYFATARLRRIEADGNIPEHFYAFMSDYLEFDYPVAFKEGGNYYESGLQRQDGLTNKGAFGRAVRSLSDGEYDLILRAGFTKTLEATEQPPARTEHAGRGFADDGQAPFERPIIERVVARPFRDAAFAAQVKSAYENTCAMTGLKIINGGGRPEVQAAHIRPVAHNGVDSVRNGLALSGTIHWMFDRGLVSIDDDYSILIAKDRVPDTVCRLLRADLKLILPTKPDIRPHPKYINYHREHVFKG